jgi:hypothetical protein
MLRCGLWLSGLLAVSAACGGSDFSSDLFGPTTGGSSTTAGNGGAGGGSTSASGVSVGVGGDSTVGSGVSGAGGSTGGGASGTGGAGGLGGASGTAGNAGTGPGTDGGSQESGSGDASVNCSALLADVTNKRMAAQVCAPTFRYDGGYGVCQTLVNGLCCHIPVASNDSEATRDYLDALDEFNKNKCVVACPAIPCPVGTPSCKPNGNGPATSFSCQY